MAHTSCAAEVEHAGEAAAAQRRQVRELLDAAQDAALTQGALQVQPLECQKHGVCSAGIGAAVIRIRDTAANTEGGMSWSLRLA